MPYLLAKYLIFQLPCFRITSVILLGLILSGCNLSVTKQELVDQTIKVTVYDGVMKMKSYTAEVGSPIHEKITQLIVNNTGNWSPNFVTYAPGVVIYGKGFSINYLGEQAIYNGATGQLARSMPMEKYGFLIAY